MTAAENDASTPAPPPKAVATATRFVNEHGESSRAVVENLGRAGARIVLVGEDGMLGDVMVADIQTGQAVVGAVEGLTAAEWDAETTGQLRIGQEYRRKMAGPRAR